jgi:hypothetical protein
MLTSPSALAWRGRAQAAATATATSFGRILDLPVVRLSDGLLTCIEIQQCLKTATTLISIQPGVNTLIHILLKMVLCFGRL